METGMETGQELFIERYGRTLAGQMKHLKAGWSKISTDKLEKMRMKYKKQLNGADGKETSDIQIRVISIEEILHERELALKEN